MPQERFLKFALIMLLRHKHYHKRQGPNLDFLELLTHQNIHPALGHESLSVWILIFSAAARPVDFKTLQVHRSGPKEVKYRLWIFFFFFFLDEQL